jgi:hypothetical protein
MVARGVAETTLGEIGGSATELGRAIEGIGYALGDGRHT